MYTENEKDGKYLITLYVVQQEVWLNNCAITSKLTMQKFDVTKKIQIDSYCSSKMCLRFVLYVIAQ